MKARDRASRPHLAHAARVAALYTLVIIAMYVVLCAGFDALDSGHLLAQVDARLVDRLSDVAHNHRIAENPPGEADDDHDVEAAPVVLWRVESSGRVVALSDNAPALPAGAWSHTGQPTTATLAGAVFRLHAARVDGRWVIAAQSLAETRHVQNVVLASELVGGPVLALAFFLGAFFIGWRAAAPVEQARRRQLEFTADASHELRTPLSVIEAEVSLALRGARSAQEYRDVIERVSGESSRLRHIVEDLLWLARFDSEPQSPVTEPVELGAVARDCVDRFGAVGLARAIVLTVHEDEPGATWINAPPAWIDRLAGVLVDNACRYAGVGGHVEIAVHTQGSRAVFAVRDSGPGIPPEERPHLFDRFHRATSEGSGSGLGLAIADAVVRSTGGRWRVDSAVLGGAEMEVSWSRYVHGPAARVRRPGVPDEQPGDPERHAVPTAPLR